MGQVIWSVQAHRDLEDIVDHIAQDSPSRAEAFHWDVLDAARVLEDHPKRGHPVPETDDTAIREIQHGNYRIIHWLKSGTSVVILTVRHGKRKLSKRHVQERKRTNR